MSAINETDEKLVQRVVDLSRLSEQDAAIITGYMAKITRLENEAKCHEYVDQTLERAQREIITVQAAFEGSTNSKKRDDRGLEMSLSCLRHRGQLCRGPRLPPFSNRHGPGGKNGQHKKRRTPCRRGRYRIHPHVNGPCVAGVIRRGIHGCRVIDVK